MGWTMVLAFHDLVSTYWRWVCDAEGNAEEGGKWRITYLIEPEITAHPLHAAYKLSTKHQTGSEIYQSWLWSMLCEDFSARSTSDWHTCSFETMLSMWPSRIRNTVDVFQDVVMLVEMEVQNPLSPVFFGVFVDNKESTTSSTEQKELRLNLIFHGMWKARSKLDVLCVWLEWCSLGSMWIYEACPKTQGVERQILHKKCNIYKFGRAWNLQMFM